MLRYVDHDSAIKIASGAKYPRDTPWDILMVPDTMRDVSERQKSCTRAKIAFEDTAGVREESRGEERRRVERRGQDRTGEARIG